MRDARNILPFVAAVAGIAVFSAMDAAMKGASIVAGVYTAVFLRSVFGVIITLPIWMCAGRRIAGRAALSVHIQRALVTSAMAPLFFYGLVRIPFAETIAISFIAPLIALYFAAVFLKETIRPEAVLASLMGIAGVMVIGAARFGGGDYSNDAVLGIAAILVSAVLYALNLVLQRKQALLADPAEIALAQNSFMSLTLSVAAPWLLIWPETGALAEIWLAAALATIALLLLSWAYARAEAQSLVPIEYTAFLWAALLGRLRFGEEIDITTLLGAALIVIGCLIVSRRSEAAPSNPPAP